ncbi:hypothetical protein RhiirC2_854700 [Rhizophagus irregularis]|uniref:Uncharacterized protein n=1 Tax=Rhizophagus irregularis TaxID=588596 RepID=A0A2N1MQK0_9GLOM|nr:hypothetical protein RhiirC2_854700 [Rhizophagus irregularis]
MVSFEANLVSENLEIQKMAVLKHEFEDRVFGCIRIRWDVSSGGSGCGILFFNSFDVRLQWNGSDMVR